MNGYIQQSRAVRALARRVAFSSRRAEQLQALAQRLAATSARALGPRTGLN